MGEDQTADLENQESEAVDAPDRVVDTANRELLNQFTELKAQLAKLEQNQLKSQRQVEEKKKAQLTEEQLQQIKENPALLTTFLESKVREATQAIEIQSKKTILDNQAHEEFPALKSNQEFRQAVVATMNELIANDNYTQESPTLLLRAAQLTAGRMNLKPETSNQRRSTPTSEEPSRPRPQVKTAKVNDDDKRVVAAGLLGISDPKALERFKSSLPPYVEPESRKGRTLSRGRR